MDDELLADRVRDCDTEGRSAVALRDGVGALRVGVLVDDGRTGRDCEPVAPAAETATVRVCEEERSDVDCVTDALKDADCEAVELSEGLAEELADAEEEGDSSCVPLGACDRVRVRLEEGDTACERVVVLVAERLLDAVFREEVALGLRDAIGERS